MPKSKRPGFTLVEIIVVISLIIVLMSISFYALGDLVGFRSLEKDSTAVHRQFIMARSQADARNQFAAWELVWFANPANPNENIYVTRVMTRPLDGSTTWRDAMPPYMIDGNVAVVEDVEYSSLMANQESRSDFYFEGREHDAEFIQVRFFPDGRTNLNPTERHYITFKSNDGQPFDPDVSNFITIAIDPVTGRAQIFQP